MVTTVRPGPRVSLLIAGFAVLMLCWAMTNPPGAVPDEPGHLVKALGTARLDLIGQSAMQDFPPAQRLEPAVTNVRSFLVPIRTTHANLGCNKSHPELTAGCLRLEGGSDGLLRIPTQIGSYVFVPYLLPGLAASLAGDPFGAVWFGRLVNVVLCALLLAVAAGCLRRHADDGIALVGLLVAATPMVLFFAGSMNTSGLELCSGLALTAVAAAASRPGADIRKLLPGVLFAGIAAATSRPSGPAWLVMAALVFAGLSGRRAMPAIRRGGRPVLVAATVLVVVSVAAVGLARLAGARSPSQAPLGAAVDSTLQQVPYLAEQVVGNFGWLDTHLPPQVVWAWFAVFAGLLLLALWRGTGGERLLIVGLLVATAVVAVAIQAVFTLPSNFGIQARYAMVPLLSAAVVAGEVISRNPPAWESFARWAYPGAVTLMALLQGLALFMNGRRNATGYQGSRFYFLHGAAWSPPGGWLPWMLVIAFGVVLMVASARESFARPR